jgi:hypothetical protein
MGESGSGRIECQFGFRVNKRLDGNCQVVILKTGIEVKKSRLERLFLLER